MLRECKINGRAMRRWFFPLLGVFLSVLGCGKSLSAQPVEYNVGLGLKLGSPCAVSVKYMMGQHHALEFLGSGWLRAGGATVLYEYHVYFSGAPALRWYLGAGGHCAYAAKNCYNPYSDEAVQSNIYAGVDGVIGMEYVFPSAPFSISLDVLPVLNVVEGAALWWNAGVSFRYTFR